MVFSKEWYKNNEHPKNRIGKTPWNKGKKMSDKSKKKLSLSRKKLSPEIFKAAGKKGGLTRKLSGVFKGANNPMWKGGKRNQNGYVFVLAPEHPKVYRGGYYPEHRIIMEKKIGRILESYEIVHHRNGKRNDNRIENLEIVALKNHYGIIRCPHCLMEITIK
jgi:hypothetical protein